VKKQYARSSSEPSSWEYCHSNIGKSYINHDSEYSCCCPYYYRSKNSCFLFQVMALRSLINALETSRQSYEAITYRMIMDEVEISDEIKLSKKEKR
jgi:hypothetical protein